MCAQRRLRSAWASAQSDQSLRCALSGYLKTEAFFMRTAKTLIRLGGFFAGRTCHFAGFVTRWLVYLMPFAPSEYSDHAAHTHSLLRVFAVCFKDSQAVKASKGEQ